MLILYAVQTLTPRYGQGAGAIAIGLYALHNVLYAAGSYPAGALADRYGKRPFLLAAYTLGASMNLILIVAAPSIVTLVVVVVLAGVVNALQQSLERAIAADLTPVEVRSTGFGMLAAVNGVGDLVSSAIVGALWTAVSPQVAFAYALVMSIAGAIVTRAALRAVGRP
jgi:MFS family permease